MGWIGLYKLDTRNGAWCTISSPQKRMGPTNFSVPCCVFPHWLVRKTPISLVSSDFVVLIIRSKVQ